jgi:hypothetical protein
MFAASCCIFNLTVVVTSTIFCLNKNYNYGSVKSLLDTVNEIVRRFHTPASLDSLHGPAITYSHRNRVRLAETCKLQNASCLVGSLA